MRRPVRFHRTTLWVASLLVAGCTDAGDPTPQASPGSGSSSPTPATTATEGAAAETDVEPRPGGTPQEVLDQFARGIREGDSELVKASIDRSTRTGQALADLMGPMTELLEKSRRFTRDVEDRFGPEVARAVVDLEGSAFDMSRLAELERRLEQASIDVKGTSATVKLDETPGAQPLEIVKRGEGWLIASPDGAVPTPQQKDLLDRSFELFGQFFDAGIELVDEAPEKGRFEERFQALQQEFRKRLAELAAGLQAGAKG